MKHNIILRRARSAPVLVALGLSVAALSGCDDPASTPAAKHPGPRTGRHQQRGKQTFKPAKRTADFPLHVDRSPFLGAGCVETGDEDELDCSAASFVRQFGCDPRIHVDELLGGLASDVAVAECRVPGSAAPHGLAQVGCKGPVARNVVAWVEGKFELIENPDAFRKRFGPVKDADAALGFALAQSPNTRALREAIFEEEGSPVPDVMGTNVVLRAKGYIVRLFDDDPCSCSGNYAVDVLVTREGDVTRLSRTMVRANPSGRCVDARGATGSAVERPISPASD